MGGVCVNDLEELSWCQYRSRTKRSKHVINVVAPVVSSFKGRARGGQQVTAKQSLVVLFVYGRRKEASSR